MNRLINILLIAALIPLVFSCKKDYVEPEQPLPNVPDGYVRAALDLSVANNDQVGTKATPEEEIKYDPNNVWALMFNAVDGKPTTIVQAPIKASYVNSKLHVLLRATTQPVMIVVVTGLTKEMNNKLANAADFKEGITSYDDVNNKLLTELINGSGIPIGNGVYFPMSTEVISHPNGTVNVKNISKALRRIVSKVDVDASSVKGTFTLEEVTLVNAARRGFVMPTPSLIYNNGGSIQYNGKAAVDNKVTSEIYIYENKDVTNDNKSNPTKLIVKGKYNGGTSSYYRMDLHKDNGNNTVTPYPMERNKHYKLEITKVQNNGYTSFAEALANPPTNAKYSVSVTDPSASDVISNGQYYLAVSNSELVVYGTVDKVVAVTVTTNAPSTVTTYTVSATGGLKLASNALTKPNGQVTKTEVIVSVPASFTGEQTITVAVGNIVKKIPVFYRNILPSGSHVIGDFIANQSDKYLDGSVVSDGNIGWLQLAANADGSNSTSANNKDVVSPNGNVYMVIRDQVRTSDAEFYLTRANDKGRVRVIATGNSVDINGLFWAKGNLVAKNNRECLIGAPTDGGLYFQYGSLIGWKGGANANNGTGVGKQEKASSFWSGGSWTWNGEAMVWPGNLSGQPDKWPNNSGQDTWYAGKRKLPEIKGDMSVSGVGDPCAYYLGGSWRLPTREEFLLLDNVGLTNQWDDTDKGRRVTTSDKTSSVFFPASGVRTSDGGSFNHVNGKGIYRASSATAQDITYADVLEFANSYFNARHSNFRIFGGHARCVNGTPPTKPAVNPPSSDQYVEINGLKWAKGNLVAINRHECVVGGEDDGGVYFQYGSLIGWKGGHPNAGGTGAGKPSKNGYWSGSSWSWSGEAMVYPSNMRGNPTSWQRNLEQNQWYSGAWDGFVDKGDLSEKGVGDPCSYYLGSPWRLPTTEEYIALYESGRSAWNSERKGCWFGPNAATQNSSLFFLGVVGYRNADKGEILGAGTSVNYWSSSYRDRVFAWDFEFSNGYQNPSFANSRAFAFPVRCVSGKQNPPEKKDYVKINGLYWAKGNLVAKSSNECKVGASTDGGLYFQFGSLIGWKGGAPSSGGTGVGMPTKTSGFWGSSWSWSEAHVWPKNMVGAPTEWPKNQNSDQWYSGAWDGFVDKGDLSEKGVGDPCTYYLGRPWRLPTTGEYEALNKTGSGSWNAQSKGRWFGPGAASADANTAIFLPCSGFRQLTTGVFSSAGVSVNYWTSMVNSNDTGWDFEYNTSNVTIKQPNARSYGFVVRCVSDQEPRALVK